MVGLTSLQWDELTEGEMDWLMAADSNTERESRETEIIRTRGWKNNDGETARGETSEGEATMTSEQAVRWYWANNRKLTPKGQQAAYRALLERYYAEKNPVTRRNIRVAGRHLTKRMDARPQAR